jgi:hypothetical protein
MRQRAAVVNTTHNAMNAAADDAYQAGVERGAAAMRDAMLKASESNERS